jgi:hypothetical protein
MVKAEIVWEREFATYAKPATVLLLGVLPLPVLLLEVLLLGGGVTGEEPLPLPLPGGGAVDEPSPPPPPHAVSVARNSEHAISPSPLFMIVLLRG